MPVSYKRSVLIAPYFFRSGTWNSGPPDDNFQRIELFAGSLLPTMIAYVRPVGRELDVGNRGDFFGYVSKTKDGVQGRIHTTLNRSSTQLVIGHLGRPTELSWIAPAPWNYAPLSC